MLKPWKQKKNYFNIQPFEFTIDYRKPTSFTNVENDNAHANSHTTTKM